jgi:hypothetical protein
MSTIGFTRFIRPNIEQREQEKDLEMAWEMEVPC